MKAIASLIVLVLAFIFVTPAVADAPRPIDVVLVLDVSGSMQDLLDSARARLWDVIGELARLEASPDVRVGLVAYGTSWSGAGEGWVVVPSDLTHDLDAVYGELMALEIGGSDEHVGRAIRTAVDTLSWSSDTDAVKILFVAGNESAHQGTEEAELEKALARAAERNILVNALFAGSRRRAIDEGWPQIAQLGRGNFSAIDPHVDTQQIPTPYDDVLLELNDRLNMTYLPYGSRGRDGFANQVAQDMNASRLGVQSCSSRVVAKGSALYDNASWDLVDAALDEDFSWSELQDDDLPEELRGLTTAERAAYVEQTRREREAVQRTIQETSAMREAYLREAVAQGGGGGGLGEAMRVAIRRQVDDC